MLVLCQKCVILEHMVDNNFFSGRPAPLEVAVPSVPSVEVLDARTCVQLLNLTL